jgi:hypothetical protein
MANDPHRELGGRGRRSYVVRRRIAIAVAGILIGGGALAAIGLLAGGGGSAIAQLVAVGGGVGLLVALGIIGAIEDGEVQRESESHGRGTADR